MIAGNQPSIEESKAIRPLENINCFVYPNSPHDGYICPCAVLIAIMYILLQWLSSFN